MSSSKETILENSKLLFAENGFKGTTVAEIAKASGITDAAIYRHYRSKQEIFDVIVTAFLAEYRELLNQIHERQQSGYCLIENVILDLCNFLGTRVIEFKVIQNAYTTVGSAHDAMDSVYTYLTETVERCLEKGIKDGTVREELDVPETANIIATMLVAINRRRIFWPETPEMAKGAVTFCQRAIKSW